jgi:hypothetical protein
VVGQTSGRTNVGRTNVGRTNVGRTNVGRTNVGRIKVASSTALGNFWFKFQLKIAVTDIRLMANYFIQSKKKNLTFIIQSKIPAMILEKSYFVSSLS